ncbi:MAG: DUF5615 family PIN-like protein [Fimbriimonas sp.]
MKILLDNCVDWRFARELSDHEVIHSKELGWERLTNGKLLEASERQGFELIVTVDKGFRYQQTLEGRRVSVITLAPVLTSLEHLLPLLPNLLSAISNLESGLFLTIEQ